MQIRCVNPNSQLEWFFETDDLYARCSLEQLPTYANIYQLYQKWKISELSRSTCQCQWSMLFLEGGGYLNKIISNILLIVATLLTSTPTFDHYALNFFIIFCDVCAGKAISEIHNRKWCTFTLITITFLTSLTFSFRQSLWMCQLSD